LVKEHKDGHFDFPPQLALDELQNIALQGAGISRFFWPADKNITSEAKFSEKPLPLERFHKLYSVPGV
jgi:hypothetical protein